jgi:HEAT repeat protein
MEKEQQMFQRISTIVSLVAVVVLIGPVLPVSAADDAVAKGFQTLKTYNWGDDRAALEAVDKAVVASSKDAAAQKALQKQLLAVVGSDASSAAKDYACRKLSLIGDAGAAAPLAALLPDKDLSHIARYALERMPCPEAVTALRGALPKTQKLAKVGVINSLGVRRDAESTAALVALLADKDQQTVAAAAGALGSIGNAEAAKALGAFQKKAPKPLKLVVADACLTCAERMLSDGKTAQATAIYISLATGDQPKHVKMAATKGLLAAKSKK